jgi:glycerol uptake facilitator-like aquaporin
VLRLLHQISGGSNYMFGRQKIATLVAEFLGTGVLTLLILSVQRSTIGVPFFVATAAGLTVALMIFVLGGISGAILNPALVLALWTARKISSLTGVLFIAAEMLGAWAAYGLYTYFVNSSLQPVGGHFTGRILVAEAVGTGLFALGWAAALYQGYNRAVTASVAGLAFMLGIIAASSASIGLLNPAVALGVRAWVWGTYVLGPILGAIIGINLFGLLFAESATAVATSGAAATRSTATSSAAKKPAKKTTRRKK